VIAPLVLSIELRRQIEREGADSFPNECCGIMFGRDQADGRIVKRLRPVANVYDPAERYHRFSIDAKQLMDAEKAAADAGEMVLGFYHSHPDHPARPSETDRQAGWPFYSYVIVSIIQRQPADMTSWVLDEQTEQFQEQTIIQPS
jgi:proteasome lid subunit RPN8/RPN11